jgi:sugar phosphate isomerase/epimerase
MFRNVKFGAPGYILLKDMSEDMLGTLKKIAALGYDGIEITGFFGHTAAQIKACCQKAGVEPFGCFVRLTELAGEKEPPREKGNWNVYETAFDIPGKTSEEKMQYIKAIGCQYVGLLVPNGLMDETITEKINKVSALARRFGMRLQYHNHDYEFNNVVNGQRRMDFIMENTNSDVLFEPDLGWLEIGGANCEKYLHKYADRIEIVHLKDYYRISDDIEQPFVFRPTGYGVVDWARLLPLCEEIIKPAWYTLDHDKAYDGDIYEELSMSLDFVKKMLHFSSRDKEVKI